MSSRTQKTLACGYVCEGILLEAGMACLYCWEMPVSYSAQANPSFLTPLTDQAPGPEEDKERRQ